MFFLKGFFRKAGCLLFPCFCLQLGPFCLLLLFHIYDLFNTKNYRDCNANRLGFLLGSPSFGKGTAYSHVAKKAARLARVKDEKRKWRALSLVNTLTNQNVVLLHKGKS